MGEPVTLPKRKTIYEAGASALFLFQIVSGHVAVFKDAARGRRHITSFRRPGDLVGLHDEGLYLDSAFAVTRVTVNKVPIQDFHGLTSRLPHVAQLLVKKLILDIIEQQNHSRMLARNDATARIAMFVDMIMHLERARTGSSEIFSMPMNRGDVAAYLALSEEATSRAFALLKREKVLEFDGKCRFKLLDRRKLAGFIGGKNC